MILFGHETFEGFLKTFCLHPELMILRAYTLLRQWMWMNYDNNCVSW